MSQSVSAVEISDQRIKSIFYSYVRSIGEDPADYTIIIDEEKEVNAYATLGNKIVVHRGIVDFLDTEVALAFVLAHELGHIEKHHAVKSLLRHNVFKFVKYLFFDESRIFDGVNYFHSLHHSRGSEEDADEYAVELINKFYCKTPGKLEFFEKMSGKQKTSKLSEYFSTHPLPSSRLQYLTESIKADNCEV